ncbi:hypothetical protein ACNTMW_05155 [Planosporangium sp. 12N6]|uniref:hypothetical protein n=1 Tax=Planosporangium spinosum TaxID=3402278 RepID=UPI003CEB0B92
MRTVLLAVHIAAGATGLLLGPAIMLAPKRPGWHPRLGLVYQALVALLCLTSIGLVAFKPWLWWLAVIGVATWAVALAGWWMRRRRPAGWLPMHISLMCGSYISFVTAFLVVNLGLDSPVAWVLPTVVGSPLIALAVVRATGRWRPRRAPAA